MSVCLLCGQEIKWVREGEDGERFAVEPRAMALTGPRFLFVGEQHDQVVKANENYVGYGYAAHRENCPRQQSKPKGAQHVGV